MRWLFWIWRLLTGRQCIHGHGACLRCRKRWCRADYHPTWYSKTEISPIAQPSQRRGIDGSAACFPLCEECWSKLTPANRLPYYHQLLKTWIDGKYYTIQNFAVDWPKVRRAVMEGR